MANEYTLGASLAVSKNGASAAGGFNANLDMVGTEFVASIQQFGTSNGQQISLGGNDQNAVFFIKNLDAAATLTVSLDTTHTQVISVIPAGKGILLFGASLTLFAKSSAGTIDTHVVAGET